MIDSGTVLGLVEIGSLQESIDSSDGGDFQPFAQIAQLDDAAKDAVRQWEYTPTLLNGEPCEVVMTVTVNFQLKT